MKDFRELKVWRKDVDETGMPNSRVSVRSQWDRRAKLEYHLLLAKDLKLIEPGEYGDLAQRATELKRMMATLIQKLKADR